VPFIYYVLSGTFAFKKHYKLSQEFVTTEICQRERASRPGGGRLSRIAGVLGASVGGGSFFRT